MADTFPGVPRHWWGKIIGAFLGLLRGGLSGAILGAFFIATDPVSAPLSLSGKVVFGAGVGVLVVLIRLLSNYPEGVVFAVLLMNAMVPLINRWMMPKPFGGALPTR